MTDVGVMGSAIEGIPSAAAEIHGVVARAGNGVLASLQSHDVSPGSQRNLVGRAGSKGEVVVPVAHSDVIPVTIANRDRVVASTEVDLVRSVAHLEVIVAIPCGNAVVPVSAGDVVVAVAAGVVVVAVATPEAVVSVGSVDLE